MSGKYTDLNIVPKEKDRTNHHMRNDDKITELIEELKELRVRESAIAQEIERRNEQREAEFSARSTRTEATVNGTPRESFRVGDRVHITNRISRPVFAPSHWSGTRERWATVKKVDGEKVHFRTDNGTETWRAAKNLSFLVAGDPRKRKK